MHGRACMRGAYMLYRLAYTGMMRIMIISREAWHLLIAHARDDRGSGPLETYVTFRLTDIRQSRGDWILLRNYAMR